jgi:hypothetical protein
MSDVRDFKSIGHVPIVGQPTIFEWRPIVSIKCSCDKGKPLLITSTDAAVRCDGCGKLYGLAFLNYDHAAGRGATVGVMEVRMSAMHSATPRM